MGAGHNLVRPVWLSQMEERPDVIVGNHPWLSYRYMSPATQKAFHEACQERGIWAGGKVATHQDLSAYFFARCVELYFKPTSLIAFVMPYATMSRQYEGFRRGVFGKRGRGRGRPYHVCPLQGGLGLPGRCSASLSHAVLYAPCGAPA